MLNHVFILKLKKSNGLINRSPSSALHRLFFSSSLSSKQHLRHSLKNVQYINHMTHHAHYIMALAEFNRHVEAKSKQLSKKSNFTLKHERQWLQAVEMSGCVPVLWSDLTQVDNLIEYLTTSLLKQFILQKKLIIEPKSSKKSPQWQIHLWCLPLSYRRHHWPHSKSTSRSPGILDISHSPVAFCPEGLHTF